MDDGGPMLTGKMNHAIHTRRYFRTSPGSIQAVMRVPHVTDNHCRLFRFPCFLLELRTMLTIHKGLMP